MLSAGRRAHQIWGRWDEVNLGLETLARKGAMKKQLRSNPYLQEI